MAYPDEALSTWKNPMISKLLIANRGEIARRIMRTAHDMGIVTVAVYSEGDARAPFVAEASEAYALHGRSAAETYLDVSKILAIASRSGADAVHPGYGFLSESASFAQAVIDAGLLWVGPAPTAITQMGDKLAAKRLVAAAGVPTLEVTQDPTAYPVLVKAAAGGGGKGMRIVENSADLAEAIASAKREAESAFGDGTVFLERYLPGARHVEVQVLGDQHGLVLHLGERDCSIQRRHQKVVEEAPSPAVADELRARLGEAAVAAARSVRYYGAGTVEFLLEASGAFWFLEMNTRLQVEHPVTEAITGIDLVAEQLRIADGEHLGYTQADVAFHGHAVEVRLYAEDPDNEFLPATGTVELWAPAASPTVRYDSGIETGSAISIDFDPMLAKVIAHGTTRRAAVLKLALALERTQLAGLRTNRDFLIETLRHPAFLNGEATTDFIGRYAGELRRVHSAEELRIAAITAALWQQGEDRQAALVQGAARTGWRNSAMPPQRREFNSGAVGAIVVAYVSQRDGTFNVWITGAEGTEGASGTEAEPIRAIVRQWSARAIALDIDGRHVDAQLTPVGTQLVVHLGTATIELDVKSRFADLSTVAPLGGLVAPMPGKILAVRATVGDRVMAGQVLVVMEAMKMEHHLSSRAAGVVTEVLIAVGEQVENAAVLLVVEAE